ncbi:MULTISPECIES: hypothetical protein [unclassified Herbaspirillum]|uniref:hypothetical protein n=1 Tax=unclassified Herbaspirillum TaxID=2624150 RepID=UPI0018274FD6|nr:MULTISPECIES: hypothetical protein [unclassified Herbaspirillum]MBB5393264.1 hypothetical protein [Herbaspirillum sp. SJZ102]
MHAGQAERLAQLVVQRGKFAISANGFFVGGTGFAAIETGGNGRGAGEGAMRSEGRSVKDGFLHGVGEMTWRMIGIGNWKAESGKRRGASVSGVSMMFLPCCGDAICASMASPLQAQNDKKRGLFFKIFAGEKACSDFFTSEFRMRLRWHADALRAARFLSK